MGADELRDLPHRLACGTDGSLHRGGITPKTHRNETAANTLDAQQLDIGRFGGGIGGCQDADQTVRLDEPDGGIGHVGADLTTRSESACIVDRVRQQPEITGALDGSYDARLLSATGTRAASGLDLADRRKKPGQHVETLVIDLFGLKLRRKFFAIDPGDVGHSCKDVE